MMTEEEKEKIRKEAYKQLALNRGCSEPSLLMFVLVGLVLILIFSCCPCKKITNNDNHMEKDSVRIEHHYEKVTEYIHDTTFVALQVEREATTTRDSSFLENSYCTSEAKINADGSLYHNLYTKPVSIPVEYDKPVTTITDNTQEEHFSQDNHNTSQIIEVPRDYTWWDKTRFYILYFICALLFIMYRKNILGFIKLIIHRCFFS